MRQFLEEDALCIGDSLLRLLRRRLLFFFLLDHKSRFDSCNGRQEKWRLLWSLRGLFWFVSLLIIQMGECVRNTEKGVKANLNHIEIQQCLPPGPW